MAIHTHAHCKGFSLSGYLRNLESRRLVKTYPGLDLKTATKTVALAVIRHQPFFKGQA